MPRKVSEPFRLRVLAPSPDNTVWLGGNGNWADGANPGNPTYNTLQAIVNSINPTTGGWAQIPNTKLKPHLVTPAIAGSIHPKLWGTGCHPLLVWGGAGFDGKSFYCGVNGGHASYNGNELYRIRITDPPAAIRMYDPAPLTVPQGNGGWGTEWGPFSIHHYDQFKWIGAPINRLICARFQFWLFNPDALTPKSAWQFIVDLTTRPSTPAHYGIERMSDTELYFKGGGAGVAIDIKTRTKRLPTRPPDPWSSSVGSIYDSVYYRRTSIALTSKLWWTGGVSGQRPHFVQSYDPSTGTNVSQGANRACPTWWATPASSPTYRNIALVVGAFGEAISAWNGGEKVWCYNAATDTMQQYLATTSPFPGATPNGVHGDRWVWVPQVGAFVGLQHEDQDAWVFRPPASWGIS